MILGKKTRTIRKMPRRRSRGVELTGCIVQVPFRSSLKAEDISITSGFAGKMPC
jgi:hypothetical protein